MNSTFNKRPLLTMSKEYLRTAKQWFLKTPERALNQAYNAALTIKSIEDEHFNGNKLSTDITNHSNSVTSYLQADIEKELSIAKLRLAEFKASRSVFATSNSAHLQKLRFIDEILEKYTYKSSNSSLLPLSIPAKTDSKNNDQSHPSAVEPFRIEPVSDQVNFLPSIGRRINKAKGKFDSSAEAEVIKKFRSSRNQTTTAIRFMLVLVLVPLLTQQVSKHFFIGPIVDHIRSKDEAGIFLNSEMEESAFKELQSFEEALKFTSLIHKSASLSPEAMEEQVKQKAAMIAEEYHSKSDSAISNVFADLLGVVAFGLVIFTSKRQIIALKSFMDNIVHGLSDSAKAFIIILFTDVFVGFHSPHGWEVILEGVASHLGLPANRNLIFLFIATFPVILDTIFKFWIFRYMSMLSPSAVATYRNMNE